MIFTSKSSLLIQTHIQASGWALNYSTRCFQTCLVHTVLTASHRFSAPHPWWEFPISPDAPLDWQPEAVQAIECSEFTVTVKKSVLNDLVLWHLVFVLLSEDAHTDHRRMDVSNNSLLGCGVQTIRARASPPPLTADRSGSMPTSLIYSWDFTNIFKCDEYNETNKIQIRLWKITATLFTITINITSAWNFWVWKCSINRSLEEGSADRGLKTQYALFIFLLIQWHLGWQSETVRLLNELNELCWKSSDVDGKRWKCSNTATMIKRLTSFVVS